MVRYAPPHLQRETTQVQTLRGGGHEEGALQSEVPQPQPHKHRHDPPITQQMEHLSPLINNTERLSTGAGGLALQRQPEPQEGPGQP